MSDTYVDIKNRAYEIYKERGFKDGNDFVDWLEAERQMGDAPSLRRGYSVKPFLFAIVGLLCAITAILLMTLMKSPHGVELSGKSLSELKVMMLVLDPKVDEQLAVFSDTHFDFGQSALSREAKALLHNNVQILKENPQTHVRMAGYTSAEGSEEANQGLSERRANAVRDYLIEEGIAPERIDVIGYGRTRPALYEVTPGDIQSTEALANMRVLFEVVVK